MACDEAGAGTERLAVAVRHGGRRDLIIADPPRMTGWRVFWQDYRGWPHYAGQPHLVVWIEDYATKEMRRTARKSSARVE